MPTRPSQGGSADTWGTELNAWLDVGHNTDGTNSGSPRLINVKDSAYGAKGDGSTDDTAAIQAALNAVDSNQGGDVFFPVGRYKITSGLTTAIQGTRLIGQGHPGTSAGQAKGSTQIIVANGITGITFNPGATPSHQTRGYAMENLHVIAATGATTGNGVLIQNCERLLMRDVTCSDFIGGYGLMIDGTTVGSANAQYAELLNYSAGDCLNGLQTQNAGPNGITMFGGYFAGAGTTPRSGSVGVHMVHGDTLRAFGVKIQGYETGMFLDTHPGQLVYHEIHGARLEFCNLGIRIDSSNSYVQIIGGVVDNSILAGGGSNIGIQIDSGASDVVIRGTQFAAVTSDVVDNGTRTVREKFTGTAPFSFYQGSIGIGGATGTQLGNGNGVLAFANAGTVPNANPSGGHIVYSEAGYLKGRSNVGTISYLGPFAYLALTYGTTVNTDASLGNRFKIPVSNGTAFTIANPTNPYAGQQITYDIANGSGGTMGAITWGNAFLLAGSFTNPANGKRRTINFYYDGASWVEIGRAAADI